MIPVVELADDCEGDAKYDGGEAEEFVDCVVPGLVVEPGPAAGGIEDLDVGLEPDDAAEEESEHDEPVGDADSASAHHAGVRNEFHHHVVEAAEGVPGAGVVGLCLAQHAHKLDDAPYKGRPRYDTEPGTDDSQRNEDCHFLLNESYQVAADVENFFADHIVKCITERA